MSRFGTTLRRILTYREMTAREVSRRSRIDPAQLSRWLNAPHFANIAPNVLSRIARAAADTKEDRAEIIAAHMQDILSAAGETQVQIRISNKPFTAALPKTSEALLTFFRREFITHPQVEKTLLELAKALGYGNTRGNTKHSHRKHSENLAIPKP